MIYLASPYTHVDPQVQLQRVKATAQCVIRGLHDGTFYYSPILHGHFAEQLAGAAPYDKWIAHGLDAIAACGEIHVLTLNGWEYSKGVQAELEYARKHNLPIRYLEAPTND